MTPRYVITANGRTITPLIDPMLNSLTVTDETGVQADRLTISLDDSGGTLELPKRGAVLGVQLGLGLAMMDCGLFTVDTVSGEGPPDLLRIEAHAVPMAGAVKMQERKSRSWHGMTLGAMVEKIAGENGLQLAMSAELAAVDARHVDQTDESDLSLLARLAVDVSAAVKITAGRLAFIGRGESRTVSGGMLATVALTRADVSRWAWVIGERDGYKSVVASYRDLSAAVTPEVVVGEGEPTYRLPHTYSNESNARRAARARLGDFSRASGGQLQLTMPARLDLMAETPLMITGIRQGLDGAYVARRVAHTLTKRGLVTVVDAERRNG